jgi:hypothetical protein
LCDCPKCRRARGEAVSPFEDFEEDDDDDLDLDEILDQTEIPPDMPPEIAKILFEETRKAVAARRVPRFPAEPGVRTGDGIRRETQERQAQIMDPREVLGVARMPAKKRSAPLTCAR